MHFSTILVGIAVESWVLSMCHRSFWNRHTTNSRLRMRKNTIFFWRIWVTICDSIGQTLESRTMSKSSGKHTVRSNCFRRRTSSHCRSLFTLGYRDDQLDRPPSNDPEVVKRRQVAVPMLIQCDKCLKWRRLPYAGNAPPLTHSQLELWRCSDNTDVVNNQ